MECWLENETTHINQVNGRVDVRAILYCVPVARSIEVANIDAKFEIERTLLDFIVADGGVGAGIVDVRTIMIFSPFAIINHKLADDKFRIAGEFLCSNWNELRPRAMRFDSCRSFPMWRMSYCMCFILWMRLRRLRLSQVLAKMEEINSVDGRVCTISPPSCRKRVRNVRWLLAPYLVGPKILVLSQFDQRTKQFWWKAIWNINVMNEPWLFSFLMSNSHAHETDPCIGIRARVPYAIQTYHAPQG